LGDTKNSAGEMNEEGTDHTGAKPTRTVSKKGHNRWRGSTAVVSGEGLGMTLGLPARGRGERGSQRASRSSSAKIKSSKKERENGNLGKWGSEKPYSPCSTQIEWSDRW